MSGYDWERCPEAAGPMTEPLLRVGGFERWPEAAGPMTDYQQIALGQGRRQVTIGPIPPLQPPAERDRDRAECERRNLLRTQVETAALEAARNAMVAQTLSAQVLADVDKAVEKAVAAAPAGQGATP
jgi:hypothetical protein